MRFTAHTHTHTHTHTLSRMDEPLSNEDVEDRLRHVNGFVGVCSYDLLADLRDGEFCVANTDNVLPLYDPPQGGHHWLTVCREKNRVLVFDSFGRTLARMEQDYHEPGLERYFAEAYSDCTLCTNTQVLQDTTTAVCGYYAVFVGRLFSEGGIEKTLHALSKLFDSDTLHNDRKILEKDVTHEISVGGASSTSSSTRDSWTDRLARDLHRPRRVHFPRRPVIVHELDSIWSADLVDMQAYAKYNEEIRHLLTVIDLFSRYAWVIPLKRKTGASVRDAFQRITSDSGRSPRKLWVDEGAEFYNAVLKRWLAERDIDMYSTHNEGKAVVVERFNRTLKSRMWQHFTAKSTNVYIDVLPRLVHDYNNSKHRSIRMTPTEASLKRNAPFVQDHTQTHRPRADPRYSVDDEVRIAVSKRHFEKGYTPNWTEEVFLIDRVLPTQPVTYGIRDLMNEPILGSFYEQQLQRTMQTQFRVDKVLRRQRGRFLVKWKGYPDKFNSWITKDQFEKL